MRAFSIDFETTGSVKGYPNEPWQLGWVELASGGVNEASPGECYFHVDRARPFSSRAPGRWALLREMLNDAPSFQEQEPNLSSFLAGSILIAHNAATERTVLMHQAPLTQFGPWFDTLRLARYMWPKLQSYQLGSLIEQFQLVKQVDKLCPARTWHDALYDACAGAVLAIYQMQILHVKTNEELLAYCR